MSAKKEKGKRREMRSQGFAFGNILRLAAYEQARRALRRECAPDSAQSAERV